MIRSQVAQSDTRPRRRIRVASAMSDGHILDGLLDCESRTRLQDIVNDARAFLPFETISGDNLLISKAEIRALRALDDDTPANRIFTGDPYAVLGVSRSDTDAVIKRSYYALLRQLHPDQAEAAELHPALVDCAAALTRRVIEAYDYIVRQRKERRPGQT